MELKTTSRLRVIIVGAGIGGLTAALALNRAGIDFIIVEKHASVLEPMGSSITLTPGSQRILHQLGILNKIKTLSRPYSRDVEVRGPNGQVLSQVSLSSFAIMHGEGIIILQRDLLIRTLYEALPAESEFFLGRSVVSVEHEAGGVRVHLSDGLSETGHLVVGSDGVRGVVRGAMWKHADAMSPGLITRDDGEAVWCSWRCLWATCAEDERVTNDVIMSSHDNRSCTTVLSPLGSLTLGVMVKTGSAGRRSNRLPTYKAEETEKMAASVAHLPLNESLTFGHLWAKKLRGGMTDIEVGVLNRWHYGRIVLVGDTAHSITPAMTSGANLCMESVVELVNALHQAVVDAGNQVPTGTDLERALSRYQERQLPRAMTVCRLSMLYDRLHAWDATWMRLWSLYLARWLNPLLVPLFLGYIFRGSPLLDFVPVEGWPRGTWSWVHGHEEMERGNWRWAVGGVAVVVLIVLGWALGVVGGEFALILLLFRRLWLFSWG
ncbi:FAD-dependent urate hydroxylase [Ophiocordyceps camponoti-floridani]|uniref:FAD-dependent urate hydroxylase n=1 Tax=Ophiocordyceps camponoti-floridani TaxID=2030778 RepID=A0A8H4Q2C4_9HYPO|nr:FAD-dependent urate hydroxylase [Ophiocordyceps camponoti-floridani]